MPVLGGSATAGHLWLHDDDRRWPMVAITPPPPTPGPTPTPTPTPTHTLDAHDAVLDRRKPQLHATTLDGGQHRKHAAACQDHCGPARTGGANDVRVSDDEPRHSNPTPGPGVLQLELELEVTPCPLDSCSLRPFASSKGGGRGWAGKGPSQPERQSRCRSARRVTGSVSDTASGSWDLTELQPAIMMIRRLCQCRSLLFSIRA